MDPSPSLRTWLTEVKALVESAGFIMSPAPFSVAAMPKGLRDLSFVVDLQSENTGQYRSDDYLVRARHTLKISVLKLIRPLDQWDSMLGAADIESALHDKLLPRTALPDTVVTWDTTRRTLTPTREQMVVDVTYLCDVDFPTGRVDDQE